MNISFAVRYTHRLCKSMFVFVGSTQFGIQCYGTHILCWRWHRDKECFWGSFPRIFTYKYVYMFWNFRIWREENEVQFTDHNNPSICFQLTCTSSSNDFWFGESKWRCGLGPKRPPAARREIWTCVCRDTESRSCGGASENLFLR